MARIRTVKPDFFTDEKLAECSVSARLLFIGLLIHADDEGRMPYSAKRIKMQVFPGDNLDIVPVLGELTTQKLISIYDVEGETYLCIPKFLIHQRVDHPYKSKCPRQPKAFQERSTNTPRTVAPEGNGNRREIEIEGNGNAFTRPPDSDEIVERIAKLHPANKRDRGELRVIPPVQCDAIIRAIVREKGHLQVEQGTKAYADAVSQWPPGEQKFVMGVVKFFDNSEYLKSSEQWSRADGQLAVSKAQERTNSNREVLLRTERACAGTDAGHGVQRVRKDAGP